VAVNNSIKVGPWFSCLNVCNHGEHYETPCINIILRSTGRCTKSLPSPPRFSN